MTKYHFWPGDHGLNAWRVDRLIELSRQLPVREVALHSIADVDSVMGFDDHSSFPPVGSMAEHLRLISEADTSVPVILGPDGRVMDGLHRIVRATIEGCSTIMAVKFDTEPPPSYTNCDPRDLPM
jgi:hypothetical protein